MQYTASTHQPPGFHKRSFAMPYRGGEIWFEHLDGIYEFEALVLEKLASDRIALCRPSTPSLVCFVAHETTLTKHILSEIIGLLFCEKQFSRVCFVGTSRRARLQLQTALRGRGFALAFFNDLEKAKEWLIPQPTH